MLNSNSFLIDTDDDGDVSLDLTVHGKLNRDEPDHARGVISPEMALSIATKLIEQAQRGLHIKKNLAALADGT